MKHPPADANVRLSTYALGCSLCRSERLEEMSKKTNIVKEVSIYATQYEQEKQRRAQALKREQEEKQRAE